MGFDAHEKHYELLSVDNKHVGAHVVDQPDQRSYVIEAENRRRSRACCSIALLLLVSSFLFWLTTGGLLTRLRLDKFYSDRSTPKSSGSKAAKPSLPRISDNADNFDWNNHVPTKWLNWTDCIEMMDMKFQCTRLTVPLDYSDPDGEQAAVALVRHQSSYPSDHEKYKGPILFNPGGPGGSGVDMVLSITSTLRRILGDEFDFIGFDPRGVRLTTPRFDVFETTSEVAKFYIETPENLNASSTSFSEVFVMGKVLGKLAEARAGKYAAHLSAATVATDMMSIVNATGNDKLQYWGLSYGTVLGATFASMFPNNVGRIVIDGVIDSEDYYAGRWFNSLRDTDAALFDIYKSCVHAGPEKCPLYEHKAELIAKRVDKLLEKIKVEPIPFFTPGGPLGASYGMIDYTLIKDLIFGTLYTTHAGGARLLLLLSKIEKQNPVFINRFTDFLLRCECPESGKADSPWQVTIPTFGIACGDAAPIDETLEDAIALYEKMAQNTTFSDSWPIHLYCSGWPIRAKDRYKGSFEHNTSYPLLLIGNTADPVTPLWNAHKMSKGFTDSVVLTQNSSGHCSISASSVCTMKAIRNYFQDGTLPKKGTVCETESSIFGNAMDSAKSLSSEDFALLQAAEGLRNLNIVPPLFGQGLPSSAIQDMMACI